MKNQWRDFLSFLKNRGAAEPENSIEKKKAEAYEEAKKRIYEIHLKERDIFYVDGVTVDTWQENSMMADCQMTGEIAKGSFQAGDHVRLLDKSGIFLMEAQIIDLKEEESVLKGIMKGNAKTILFLCQEQEEEKRELFLQSCFLLKKKEEERH